MADKLFIISSALNVKQLSVFNNEERFLQTVETIKSIDKYCPDSVKLLFDTSYQRPNMEYIEDLKLMNVDYLDFGADPRIASMSEIGLRSFAETMGLIATIEILERYHKNFKRIYKISGRYKLNENFVPDHEDYKDSFVFLPTVNSWMDKAKQEEAGVDRIFELRLWHMDTSLFPTFHRELYNIFEDMKKYNIDVEHAYYKNLNKYKWTSVQPIGLQGALAPTGVIINE